ncbi:MAG: phospholipid carrier-dependent glycosyltransferase [Candidatus Binataceae bacterium]
MIGSVRFDSATFDEPNHIARGFGYLHGECGLSPQHPPLFELLSAFTAESMLHPRLPSPSTYLQDVAQGDARALGDSLLFTAGNDADQMLFWSRVPAMVLSTVVGAMIYLVGLEAFDPSTALIATLLYAFSPTVLAHSRYATTDIAAVFGFLVGIVSYMAFLERPSRIRTLLAGLALGVALLTKFSTSLLFIVYPILLAEWLIATVHGDLRQCVRGAAPLIARSVALGAIAGVVVWGIYGCLMINCPVDEQAVRTRLWLSDADCPAALAWLITEVSSTSFIRPLGQYLLGIAIAHGHVANGPAYPVYFMGMMARGGSYGYFPILYSLKEPLPVHLLTVIGVSATLLSARRAFAHMHEGFAEWMRGHFVEIGLASFVVTYWLVAVSSNLNLGIRHLLPTFPAIYLLVVRRLVAWIERDRPQTALGLDGRVLAGFLAMGPRGMLVAGLLAWLISESFLIYPHYLSYYNEVAGGSWNGHWYAAESNYDWGQDYRGLQWFVRGEGIERIAVDGFESASLRYYLGGAYIPWRSALGPPHGWFAISITRRDKAWARAPGGRLRDRGSYAWLRGVAPVGRIGYCIWLYKFP